MIHSLSLPKLLSSLDRHLRINVKKRLTFTALPEDSNEFNFAIFCHFLRTRNSLSRKPSSSTDYRGHVIPANTSSMVLWIQQFTKYGHVSRVLSVLFANDQLSVCPARGPLNKLWYKKKIVSWLINSLVPSVFVVLRLSFLCLRYLL